MKKLSFILIILTFICFEAHAQHAFGVRGGAGTYSVKFKPVLESVTSDILPTFGVSYRYRGGDKFLGGVEVDLLYLKSGISYKEDLKSSKVTKRYLNGVTIPFLWQPHFSFGKKDNASIFLNLGPYFGFTFSSSDVTVEEKGKVLETIPYDFNSIKDNVVNYGLTGGGGVSFGFGNIDIVAEARYGYGFSDVLKNPNKYPQGNFTESPLSGLNITLGVYYKLIRNKK